MLDVSHFLLAAFVFWAPASLLLALVAGAALGRLKDDEFSRDALVVAVDRAGVRTAVKRD
jgi:hypothetical protein